MLSERRKVTLFQKEKKRNKNMRLFFLFYFACVSEQITVSEQKGDEEELCKVDVDKL